MALPVPAGRRRSGRCPPGTTGCSPPARSSPTPAPGCSGWPRTGWSCELTHGSGTALGLAIGLQFLPQLLFSLWGGVIADRYRKRTILLATQAIMGVLALVLGVLALTGLVAVWQVYLLAFALGLVAVVDNPARQTFVAEMVGREGLPNAVALNSATFNLARITRPGGGRPADRRGGIPAGLPGQRRLLRRRPGGAQGLCGSANCTR